MMTSKTLGLGAALRTATFAPRASLRNQLVLRSALQKRFVQTESLTPTDQVTILNTQRLKRPSSPHFTIYQPQLTWLGSIANRVTGGAIAGLMYAYAIAYIADPVTFDSSHFVSIIASLPEAFKYTGKALLAAPFAFHSFNGLRHLLWDSGKFMTVKGCYSTGYAVIGATAVATVGLTMW